MSEKEYVFVGNAQLKTRDYIKQLEKDNKEKDKEIERLNNIINNFKKDIEVIEQIENIEIMKMQLRNIAFRLKGSDKE